uniref:Ovule protein n=1 Tax=Ascaris lumbricoides TaxID=6252 RepID=A0A9J2PV79_ASCLU
MFSQWNPENPDQFLILNINLTAMIFFGPYFEENRFCPLQLPILNVAVSSLIDCTFHLHFHHSTIMLINYLFISLAKKRKILSCDHAKFK